MQTPFIVPAPTVPIDGITQRFPVHRIYRVACNYAGGIDGLGASKTFIV